MAYEDGDSREMDGFLTALNVDDLMDAEDDQQLDETQELLGVVPAPSSDTLSALGQAPSEGGSGELQSGKALATGLPLFLVIAAKQLA